MNFQTKLIIGVLAVASVIFFQVRQQNVKYSLSKNEINAIIVQATQAFDKAETDVLGVKPNPTPDPDKPKAPDPDPSKCICGGTGEIVQGDGHITQCPYHGSKDQAVESNIQYFEPEAKIYVYPRRQGFLNRLFFNQEKL